MMEIASEEIAQLILIENGVTNLKQVIRKHPQCLVHGRHPLDDAKGLIAPKRLPALLKQRRQTRDHLNRLSAGRKRIIEATQMRQIGTDPREGAVQALRSPLHL